jgi:hypothetical protein
MGKDIINDKLDVISSGIDKIIEFEEIKNNVFFLKGELSQKNLIIDTLIERKNRLEEENLERKNSLEEENRNLMRDYNHFHNMHKELAIANDGNLKLLNSFTVRNAIRARNILARLPFINIILKKIIIIPRKINKQIWK